MRIILENLCCYSKKHELVLLNLDVFNLGFENLVGIIDVIDLDEYYQSYVGSAYDALCGYPGQDDFAYDNQGYSGYASY